MLPAAYMRSNVCFVILTHLPKPLTPLRSLAANQPASMVNFRDLNVVTSDFCTYSPSDCCVLEPGQLIATLLRQGRL
jgi:hypothetical protein